MECTFLAHAGFVCNNAHVAVAVLRDVKCSPCLVSVTVMKHPTKDSS
jgi:hypothetical protein